MLNKPKAAALAISLFTSIAASYAAAAVDPDPRSFRNILDARFKGGAHDVNIGASIGHQQWGTTEETLMNKHFSYITPKNSFKQTVIHPKPGADPSTFNWTRADAWIAKAKANDQVVRIHGPISPQSSKWVLEDARTAAELEQMLVEFMQALCQRYNSTPEVKWLDVVNETINEDGSWFGPKPGTNQWENPWPKMGMVTVTDNRFPTLKAQGVPRYIIKAFEVANAHAPDLQLIINQHRIYTPKARKVLKELVIYLREVHGFRVDGIGWQAHFRSEWVGWTATNKPAVTDFDALVKWAHNENLSFHVTENNLIYKNTSPYNPHVKKAYASILKTLLKNRHNGEVSWNIWGVQEATHFKNTTQNTSTLWDKALQPRPAFYTARWILENHN